MQGVRYVHIHTSSVSRSLFLLVVIVIHRKDHNENCVHVDSRIWSNYINLPSVALLCSTILHRDYEWAVRIAHTFKFSFEHLFSLYLCLCGVSIRTHTHAFDVVFVFIFFILDLEMLCRSWSCFRCHFLCEPKPIDEAKFSLTHTHDNVAQHQRKSHKLTHST